MLSRIKEIAPSAVSAASMLLGLASVAAAASGRIEMAAWLIVYCTFLDKADGSLARALGATSRFGMEMDSYSDFTSFGVAPAALAWFSMVDCATVPAGWAAFASLSWVLLAAIRLARFNIDESGDGRYFTGIPTTLAAGVYASLFLTLERAGLTGDLAPALVPAFLALGISMVGRTRIPKIRPRTSRTYNVFQYSMILLALVVAVGQVVPWVLLVLSGGYLVIGGIAGRLSHTAGGAESG